MSLALHHQQQGGPLVLYFVGAIAASTTILCPLAAAAAAATTTTVSSSAAPSGLLADWLHSPAVGVSLSPRYSWVVPHITENGEAFSCPHTEQRQTAFQIQLSQQRTFGKPPQQRSEKGRVHWDSGRVVSAGSHQVAHPLDRSLRPATRYWWRVRTWTSAACMSQWSSAAELFTAPAAFSNQTKPIWVGTSQARYVLLRKVIPVPETPYVNAVAFVTAAQSGPMEKLLGSYRLFVGGNAVAVGPGRGNVRTAAYSDGGDKNHTQFDSIDLSGAVRAAGQVPLVIGLRCYHDTGSIAAKVLLELHLEHANGTHSVVGTNESWHGFNATAAFGPGLSEGPNTACYTAPQENIDARLLPHGWQHANFVVGAQWVLAEARQFEFIPRRKKTKPLELLERVPPPVWLQLEPRLYFADFRTNLMGGLRLVIGGARAGTKVRVTMSEELADPESHTLLYPMRTGNHYRAIWITRAAADGPSVIEHHEFKLFRYVEVLVLGRGVVYATTNTCAKVNEAMPANMTAVARLHCPQDGGRRLISAVRFASFGTAVGSCNEIEPKSWRQLKPSTGCSGTEHGGGGCGDTFSINKTCHAQHSLQVVQQQCLGHTACRLAVSPEFYQANACPGVTGPRWLAVDVQCGNLTHAHRQHQRTTESRVVEELQNYAHSITINLTAWRVRYPWSETDYSFHSDNPRLDSVWQLSVNTLRTTSLDTATDSNTRERLPYEGDALITGHSRLSLQREFAWPRHSFRHNIENPTNPTEWRQTAALLALLDYEHTGSLELFEQFAEVLEAQSQVSCVNASNGLVDFTQCRRNNAGLGSPRELTLVDLIDTPAVGTGRGYRDGYVLNEVSTVINSYAVGALRALERLYATSSTNKARRKSAQLGHQANATSDAINKRCVNHSSGLYSDGAFGKAQHHSAWHANVWPISFNLQSPLRWPSTLAFLRRKRMAGSVYGAYWLLRALYNMDVDHGDLALELLTSCDTNSWCSMLRAGATTVMEAWSREGKPNLSWSHPWASAPASAITWGFFGIRPTSAGFKTFIFQPQPGNVTRANITVPTLSGFIYASIEQPVHTSLANRNWMRVTLRAPASTMATVCLPKLAGLGGTVLWLDGEERRGYARRDYVCLSGVGSKASARVIVRGVPPTHEVWRTLDASDRDNKSRP